MSSTGEKLMRAANASATQKEFFEREARAALETDYEARKMRPGRPGFGLWLMQQAAKKQSKDAAR